jgi:hypothetical protein
MKKLLLSFLLLFLLPSVAGAQTFIRLQPHRETDTIDGSNPSLTMTTERIGSFGSVKVQTLDTYSGTWEIQCSLDGTTFDTDNELGLIPVDGSTVAYSVTDEVGIWDVTNASGCRAIKLIATAGFAATDVTVVISATQSGGTSSAGGSSAPAEVDDSNRARVVGAVPRDDAATNVDPVIIGGCASQAVPAGMSADDDAVCAWLSRHGAVHVLNTAGTSTLTNTDDSASSATLIASNAGRLHAKCFNDSPQVLYINYGATASATAFTEKVEPGGSWMMELPIYTGAINGIWAADASGAARCTELTQ